MSEGHKVIRQCPKEGWEHGERSGGKNGGVAEVPGLRSLGLFGSG